MRKIFLDCGGHNGLSVRSFKKSKQYTDDFEIYSFEPVEFVAKQYKDMPGINFSNAAIWIFDGEIDFYINKTYKSTRGNSLIKEKISGGLDKENPIKTPCIDFSQWVIDNFDKGDFIQLKMDIEGAEYEVLNKMIKDGSIDYVDKINIEFHYDKINLDKNIHDDLMRQLKDIFGVNFIFKENKIK